jgi:excisionase family DNA binding protein
MSTKEPLRPRWYSMKEAAEYLDVGEPTLYRWIKEGRVTHRKVGDSTRFWQEDLDAVMEVFHSKRDASKVKEVCPMCHHDELVLGRLQSTGLNYFQPEKTRFLTLLPSNISTQARMCARCGVILLFGDTAKLAKLRKEAETRVAQPERTEAGPVKSSEGEKLIFNEGTEAPAGG